MKTKFKLTAMQNLFKYICLLLLMVMTITATAQSKRAKTTATSGLLLRGTIRNYAGQPITISRCAGDTLVVVDSTRTNEKGEFRFTADLSGFQNLTGLCKVKLLDDQFFYLLCDGNPLEIKTVFEGSPFANIATDSLVVIVPPNSPAGVKKSAEANRQLYRFQRLQQQLNVANYYLLPMMRMYPRIDKFHPQIEAEYLKRYREMDQLVRQQIKADPQGMATKIASAFYLPVNPDWKLRDAERDTLIAAHYFDYFNPADPFYLRTNVLPEKMNIWLALHAGAPDKYNQSAPDERLLSAAASGFIEKTFKGTPVWNADDAFNFCLNFYLKKFNKEHREGAFLALYDTWFKTQEGDCGTSAADRFSWARQKAGVLRGVEIGSIAPDFALEENGMKLSSITDDHILLIFWASWCTHCQKEMPEIKTLLDNSGIRMTTIAVSIDTDSTAWEGFVKTKWLTSWIHSSELKGWKGNAPKLYNVYATPTMLLLDKDKRILAKPDDVEQLKQALNQLKIKN